MRAAAALREVEMVFFRRRGLHEKQKPTWKKYSIAYSGSVLTKTVYQTKDGETYSTLTYYDGFVFPLSGNPSLGTKYTTEVSYMGGYKNANKTKGKIFSNYGYYYFGTNDDATREFDSANQNYCVYKKGIKVTAATARSLAIAGDYIEDVESEDPNAYPDNGPLGLYYYVKQ